MIKIPATKASYEVMYELMKNGISVNATLIFSLEQSQKCFEALNAGLVEFRKNNIALKEQNTRTPQAVISIFVSRFDRLLNPKAKEQNRIGILNANLAYNNIYSKMNLIFAPCLQAPELKEMICQKTIISKNFFLRILLILLLLMQ